MRDPRRGASRFFVAMWDVTRMPRQGRMDAAVTSLDAAATRALTFFLPGSSWGVVSCVSSGKHTRHGGSDADVLDDARCCPSRPVHGGGIAARRLYRGCSAHTNRRRKLPLSFEFSPLAFCPRLLTRQAPAPLLGARALSSMARSRHSPGHNSVRRRSLARSPRLASTRPPSSSAGWAMCSPQA